MNTIEILNRFNGHIIFTHECADNTILKTVTAALAEGANLTGANLTGADMTGANLTGIYLWDSDLTDSDLTGANLTDSDMSGSDMSRANLWNSNLTDTDLTCVILTGADMTGANLTGAYLPDADLSPIRDDIWAILSSSPLEVPALISAIAEGNVDGSTYNGRCTCLVGTLARAQGISVDDFDSLIPNSNRPAERFFLGIRPGDNPENSQLSKIAHGWCVEWLNNMRSAFAV